MKSFYFKFILSLFFAVSSISLDAQEIFLSNEIELNGNDEFRLIGELQDTVLLFHQDGNTYEVKSFNKNLEYLFTKELSFEKQRIHFNLLVGAKTDFTLIYSYEDRFNLNVKARKYDIRGNIIDSTSIFQERDYLDIEHFYPVLNEDESKVLLSRSTRSNRLEFILFDLETNQKIWYRKMEFSGFSINSDLSGLLLTDKGLIVVSFEQNNFIYQRKKHSQYFFMIDPFKDRTTEIKVDMKGKLSSTFNFVSDEKNGEIVVAGLYAPKSLSKASGYYIYKLNEQGITQPIVFEPFRPQLLLDYSGKSRNPKKFISDLRLKDLLLRNDGGMVLITEMQKEILRESVRRRYVDYHYEDVVLLAVHPEGELFWDQLIRKYQLSYDDRAMFSSYFLFENPSGIRLIFNDEIKNENTISEYVFNPLGKGKRNSLLSTDLHRLKLIFVEAKQISPNAFLVPSVFNSEFRIVKISYGAN